MNFILTSLFERAYRNLPNEVKLRAKESLKILATDIRYPSLRVKKIKCTKDIWQAHIDLDYQMTLQIIKDNIILRNIGHHSFT